LAGIIALMDAMDRFDYEDSEAFEKFARAYIHEQLVQSLESSASSPPPRKARRSRSNASALSVESTVEIDDPVGKHYSNEEDWEVEEGLVLDNGHELRKDELVEDFLDESLIYEGDDQMWVHQQQVSAPLRDSIPDETNRKENELDLDESALKDMIRYDVDQFLGSTLTELEAKVIRLKYGLLENGSISSNPKTKGEVAKALKMPLEDIKHIQQSALDKLRKVYADKFLKDADAEENFYEDTV
jgi:RNA polymerase sigma factor (sigma-70 family)